MENSAKRVPKGTPMTTIIRLMEAEGIVIENKDEFKAKLRKNLFSNDKYKENRFNAQVIRACVETAKIWMPYLKNKADVNKLAIENVLSYAQCECSVFNNQDTECQERLYIGTYADVNSEKLPPYYFSTMIKKGGTAYYTLPHGLWEELYVG